VDVYSIGFTGRSAESFFGALRDAGVKRVLDVRLYNTSNLAGFARRANLPFFLREIVGAEYAHDPMLAPSSELFEGFKKTGVLSWEEYEREMRDLLEERGIERHLDPGAFAVPTALLCACSGPERCHRRLVLEHLRAAWGSVEIVHL
jgi:uncharacterized protein (DUF488 family)